MAVGAEPAGGDGVEQLAAVLAVDHFQTAHCQSFLRAILNPE
jgi:hypothetical protein